MYAINACVLEICCCNAKYILWNHVVWSWKIQKYFLKEILSKIVIFIETMENIVRLGLRLLVHLMPYCSKCPPPIRGTQCGSVFRGTCCVFTVYKQGPGVSHWSQSPLTTGTKIPGIQGCRVAPLHTPWCISTQHFADHLCAILKKIYNAKLMLCGSFMLQCCSCCGSFASTTIATWQHEHSRNIMILWRIFTDNF